MPLPDNKKNDQYQRLERRKQVAELYLHGATQWEIARMLQVSQGTICNDLAAIRTDWLDSTLRDFDQMKAEELAKLDALERQAWEAWERSCRDAETKHERTEEAVQAMPMNEITDTEAKEEARLAVVRRIVQRTTKTQAGDPRFLERVAWCIECRVKIMGVLKGEKNVQVIQAFDWDAFTRECPDPHDDPIEKELAELGKPGGEPGARMNGIGAGPSSNGKCQNIE